jgi:hypothetical protein
LLPFLEKLKTENKKLNERIDNLMNESTKFNELIEANARSKALIKEKDLLIAELQLKLAVNDRHQHEYTNMEEKYLGISNDLDAKCREMNAEINRLNVDKEKMSNDLIELRQLMSTRGELVLALHGLPVRHIHNLG